MFLSTGKISELIEYIYTELSLGFMKKTTLLIMAAGIGSRFGGGIKQLEPVGLHDEIIMDYSIYDAIEAGFNRIIFVIRKAIEERGIKLVTYTPTNQIFIDITKEQYEKLSTEFALSHTGYLPNGNYSVRICTSWATKDEEVEKIIQMIKEL